MMDKMNNEAEFVDMDKLITIKEKLVKSAEEFLYADEKKSAATIITDIFELVREQYDF